jgi:hypothetical protein
MTPHTDISGDRIKEIIREFIDSAFFIRNL